MPRLRQPLPNRTRTRLAALCGFALTFLALLAAAAAPAQNRANWTLDDILKRLDEEAKRFRGLTASLERTKVTVVVNDRSTESGQIYVRRDDKMLLELSVPEERTILRTGDDLYIFHPRTKRLEQYDLGKHRALVDEYLLLGFGTSGNDLKRGFLVTILGEPTLGGRRVVLLELTPKSEQVRQQISKVHLWIDQATWLPVQQKFFETGSGDYFEIRYSQIVRNPSLPDSRFKPRWPKGITRVRPQA
jgi:outer membrane lipoprotein-sorting protein